MPIHKYHPQAAITWGSRDPAARGASRPRSFADPDVNFFRTPTFTDRSPPLVPATVGPGSSVTYVDLGVKKYGLDYPTLLCGTHSSLRKNLESAMI